MSTTTSSSNIRTPDDIDSQIRNRAATLKRLAALQMGDSASYIQLSSKRTLTKGEGVRYDGGDSATSGAGSSISRKGGSATIADAELMFSKTEAKLRALMSYKP